MTLHVEMVGDALEVRMHRDPCNEIGLSMLAELEKLAALIESGADGARAVIFYSTIDKGFCAGADLRELYQGLVQERDASTRTVEVRSFLDRIHAVFNTIDAAPMTTIAAVHGFCFGGGFELALTCDIVVADKSARFAFPELRLGLVPGFGGIPRLNRDVGNAVVRDILFTGRSINATKANEVGLVSQVVARDHALKAARAVATQAARFDAKTTAAAKAFAKPIPFDELEREKELFLTMMQSPVVESALHRFVNSTDVRPYLP
ncbi:MAG: enoyl-CoA hydratase/isomerase family protein [Polyangiales bacterium]